MKRLSRLLSAPLFSMLLMVSVVASTTPGGAPASTAPAINPRTESRLSIRSSPQTTVTRADPTASVDSLSGEESGIVLSRLP